MHNNTTDGSFDNEAVKIANAFKPFWKKWMKEWGRNCVRSKKMTVTTAPSILTGLIGVTDAFSDTECMIPFQMNVANANVGDTVWVKWMYDNQQTMYAENMGNIRSEKVILSGVKNAEPVPSGGSVSYSISFEKPFKETPVVVASMISPHSVETGLCSVRIWDVSPFAFTVGYQNGSQYSRNIGASWIATGELLNHPIQYITDTTPYLNRAIPYSSNYLNLNKIIGGTICWNQKAPYIETGKWNVVSADSYTLTSGVATVHKNSATGGQCNMTIASAQRQTSVAGHKYLFVYTVQTTNGKISLIPTSAASDGQTAYAEIPNRTEKTYLWQCGVDKPITCAFRGYTGSNVTSEIDFVVENVECFDLTQMFGSTIADYIVSLETANAGSGVAWFKSLFPNDYYDNDSGSLMSVKTSAHVTRDANNNVVGNYPLDSSIDFRGILKLDASNELYYDGDIYTPDGNVSRKFGFRAYQSGDATDGADMITDGTNTVYRLTAPTTETATSYTKTQTCDPNGTEEFIDGRTVEMPVGNETQYIVM